MVARCLFNFFTRFDSDDSVGLVLEKTKNSRAPDSLENVMIDPSVSFNDPLSMSIIVYAEFTQSMAEATSSLNPVTYGTLP